MTTSVGREPDVCVFALMKTLRYTGRVMETIASKKHEVTVDPGDSEFFYFTVGQQVQKDPLPNRFSVLLLSVHRNDVGVLLAEPAPIPTAWGGLPGAPTTAVY